MPRAGGSTEPTAEEGPLLAGEQGDGSSGGGSSSVEPGRGHRRPAVRWGRALVLAALAVAALCLIVDLSVSPDEPGQPAVPVAPPPPPIVPPPAAFERPAAAAPLGSSGCGSLDGWWAPAGTTHAQAFDVDNVSRGYRLRVPASYRRERPLPLVLVFHGYDESATEIEQSSRLSELAEDEEFIVAYPQG